MALMDPAQLCNWNVHGSAPGCCKVLASSGAQLGFVNPKTRRFLAEALVVPTAVISFVAQSCSIGNRNPQLLLIPCTSDLSVSSLEQNVTKVRSFCHTGRLEEAIGALEILEQQGHVAPLEIYGFLLQECAKRKALAQARLVHGHLARNRLHLNSHLGNHLVQTFVQCGSLSDALLVLHSLPRRFVSSWTAVISGYTDTGQDKEALYVYRQMQEAGVEPNKYTFLSALKACVSLRDLEQGKRIHADIVNGTSASDVFVGTMLFGMYAKCGSIVDARNVFETLSKRDVVSWNAMISGYVKREQGEQALELYAHMQNDGVKPNDRTFVSLLKACGNLAMNEETALLNGQLVKVKCLLKGKQIHAEATEQKFESDVFVGNTLVDMYVKCRSMGDAQHVFDMLCERNVVTWNALLAGYALQEGGTALQLYAKMQEEGVMPEERTFVAVLKACGSLAAFEQASVVDRESVKLASLQKGRAVHAWILNKGQKPNLFVGAALVDMYAKCGSLVDARNVFDALSQRDVVTWTALIAGYAEQGQGEKALVIYALLQEQGLKPTRATFLSILKACGSIGALHTCSKVHHDIVQSGLEGSVTLATTLIHAYGKCGSMDDAQHVFDTLANQDVFSWTALIAGYAHQGEASMSLQCFSKMLKSDARPDAVTFLSALAACSHAGLVEQGLEYFELMSRSGIAASIEHYATLVDLLGRAGLFDMVEELLLKMPVEPNMPFWLCILGACLKHNNVHIGKFAFDGAVKLEPKLGAPYVMMANIFTRAGMWDDASKVEDLRRMACPWKPAGLTWIEHGEEVHVFVVGDTSHQQKEEVYAELKYIGTQMDGHARDLIMICD